MADRHPPRCVLDENCPLRQMFDLVADRWTATVLFVLSGGVQRYSDLQKRIPGVTKKMLTQTLRSLERRGLIEGTVYPVVPPRTEYRLTDLGLLFLDPINELASWAVAHENDLRAITARGKTAGPDAQADGQ